MSTAGSSSGRRPDPIGELRDRLRDAAADRFAGVMAQTLGEQLRRACAAALASAATTDEWATQLRRFETGLERFEERGRQDRSRVVAHGLRICANLAASAPRAPRVSRRSSPEPPGPAPLAGQEPLSSLPGVGPKTAEKLTRRGLGSVLQLAQLIPAGYEDRRRLRTLDAVQEGERVLIEATVLTFRQGWFRGRYSATMRVRHGTPQGDVELEARWFHHVGGMPDKIASGQSVRMAGAAKRFRGAWSMVHPEILDPEQAGSPIAVRYPAVEGIGPRTVQKLCSAALDRLATREWPEALPAWVLREYGLPRRFEALVQLHRPPADLDERGLGALQAGTSPAHRRLAFEELFFLQLVLLQRRAGYRGRPCAIEPLAGKGMDPEGLRACLPFEPTGAQWRVIREIEADLGASQPMLRLLQGDVGSGKTAVAFAAARAVVAAKAQVAIMAPTEILAEQHYRTLRPWCERAGIRVGLLTASVPKPLRATALALLGGGQTDLVVGTHALLVGDVRFARLGLVVVDEQHRFGVEQRTILRDKGDAPHLLVMTATPIPRSLALTVFGELDVSVLDELPPGRRAPTTRVFYGKRALETVRRELRVRVESGARAFVVCPLVEASEVLDVSDVEATAAALRTALPDTAIGVVHGRMPGAQKDAIMAAFREGEVQVLVATTVIEVGVDVPDATVMLVEHAERFGLAQLHQLRGRVGRGEQASCCLVHTAYGRDSTAGERLRVLEECSDGFAVAEHDLALRGAGELFGTRQSGVTQSWSAFAGEGLRLLVAARDAATRVLDEDPGLSANPALAAELSIRIARGVYSGESG